jgi:hypothetical protein
MPEALISEEKAPSAVAPAEEMKRWHSSARRG